MATTKAVTVLFDSVALVAAAGDQTSAAVNLTDGFGGVAEVKLTNGGTGPTVAAEVQLQASADDSNYYEFGGPLTGSTTSSAVRSWVIDIPIGVMYLKAVAGSNTGQNVTVRVEMAEVTAVA